MNADDPRGAALQLAPTASDAGGEFASRYVAFARPALVDLKRKSLQGGLATLSVQAGKLVLQTVTIMLLARLLSAEDFGIQGMVVALTGFLGLFREAGLGTATVQRLHVSHEQISTLFWINGAVGVALAAATVILAPALVAFYREPRLYWVAVVSAVAFVFSGLAAQHQALLHRGMRFVAQAKIEIMALAISSALGIVMALRGWHYWALVGMAVVGPVVTAIGVWAAVPWRPGLPRRECGIRSMLHFGWRASANNVVVFLAWNAEKILLGRFWGADSLGLYGRAYQLVTLPVLQLNSAVTTVAFPALARIQDDAERLSRSFLRGYSLLVSLTIPITITSGLFAGEIVRVVLGANWMEATPIFRLLAPTTLVFALVNPISWLLLSTGRAGRALSISAATTPVVILGIALGMSRGPQGVALGYSLTMVLLVAPVVAWSKLGTGIVWADLLRATKEPLLSGVLAGIAGLLVKAILTTHLAPPVLLAVGLAVVFGIYASVLLFAMGQKTVYVDLVNNMLNRPPSHVAANRS